MNTKLKEYQKLLKNIINAEYVHEYEIIDDFAIALSLCVIKNMDVFVYGGGTDSYSFIKFLHTYGIHPKKVLDMDEKKNGTFLDHVEIIHPSHLIDHVTDAGNTFIFIHTAFFRGMKEQDIIKFIVKAGVSQYYPLTKEDRYIITSNTSYWVDQNRELFYQNHVEQLEDTLSLLEDECSCRVMLEYLRTYLQKDVYRLEQLPCRYKYFYDYNRQNKSPVKLYQHKEDEVWLNCGAYKGDNIFYYFAAVLKAKRIFAVEGDKKMAEELCENVNRLPESYKDLISIKNAFIDGHTDFNELLEKNRVTLLNADIEGYELSLLKTCKNVIRSDRPVIAICMYHKKEDLIEIPQCIHSIVKDYKFYLRKYGAHYGNENRNKELVLYAVPEERTIHT